MLPSPCSDHWNWPTWYFPAEPLAVFLHNLSPKFSARRSETKLRPRIATVAGSVYKGRSQRCSMDVDAHWI